MATQDARPMEHLDSDLKRIREAQDFVEKQELHKRKPTEENMSSKVMVLKKCLDHIFERSYETRCIVFVRRRYTARILAELFTKLAIPNLHLGLLIGTRSGEAGDVKISFRQQLLVLKSFKDGDVNCLVSQYITLWAYKVAKEDSLQLRLLKKGLIFQTVT